MGLTLIHNLRLEVHVALLLDLVLCLVLLGIVLVIIIGALTLSITSVN